MTLTLPWPPSVNRYWRRTNTHRTALTDRALRFRRDVEEALLEQLGAGWRTHIDPDTRVAVRINACPPDHRRRDLDNLLKPTLDALEHALVFTDDSQVDDLHIRRAPVVKGGRLHLDIQEAT